MKQSQLLLLLAAAAAVVMAPGCTVVGEEDGAELDQLEGVSEGAQLFNQGTFGGNGTLCKTCHLMADTTNTGTIKPADVQALFNSNPNAVLFKHDRADVIGGNTFNRIRTHATILIDRALPANVSLVGSSARSVILARGVPTVMNTPSMDSIFMYDGRDPNLQVQAQGAITGHAQGGTATAAQLDSIAAFQQTLFNRQNVKSFVQNGTPLTMPAGRSSSEKRGRRFFIDDGLSDMDSVGESFTSACGWCHSGDNLNTSSAFFGENIFPGGGFPEGIPFNSALVSELNPLGNPVYTFDVTAPDGTVSRVSSPDPGLMLTIPDLFFFNVFKVGSLWGVKDTAPYFHDNSSKTFEQLMEHYDIVLNIISDGSIDLSAQDKADIIAYMKLL